MAKELSEFGSNSSHGLDRRHILLASAVLLALAATFIPKVVFAQEPTGGPASSVKGKPNILVLWRLLILASPTIPSSCIPPTTARRNSLGRMAVSPPSAAKRTPTGKAAIAYRPWCGGRVLSSPATSTTMSCLTRTGSSSRPMRTA
jgi:hypothetical protein